MPEELQGQPVARCRNVWKLDKPKVGGPGNYYVEAGTDDPSDILKGVDKALLITRVGETEWTTRSLFETDLPRLDG